MAATLVLTGCGGESLPPSDSGASIYPFTPVSEPGQHQVELVDTRRIVPGPGLPAEVGEMNSNNNLDVVRHSDGRVYLAWRSAPDHFAGPETLIHVVSSDDEETWRYEASFSRETDLREPRLLSWNGRLSLYISVLGLDRRAFEPMGAVYSELMEDGAWAPLQNVAGSEGEVVWRTRVENGQAYMVGYLGGENIYRFDGTPLTVQLWQITDEGAREPVGAAGAAVLQGGGSEADFTLSPSGELFAVVRNEAGDESGFGSHICRAPASDIADWTCRHDARKFDSPLMFWHEGEAYLVARRNVTPSGNFELEHPDDFSRQSQALANQLEYSLAPKRCALWRYLPEEDRIAFILDLPSRGDTCFPAWIRGANASEIIIYNYSSDIEGQDVVWSEGQAGATYIYRHTLRFQPRAEAMD